MYENIVAKTNRPMKQDFFYHTVPEKYLYNNLNLPRISKHSVPVNDRGLKRHGHTCSPPSSSRPASAGSLRHDLEVLFRIMTWNGFMKWNLNNPTLRPTMCSFNVHYSLVLVCLWKFPYEFISINLSVGRRICLSVVIISLKRREIIGALVIYENLTSPPQDLECV